MKKFLDKHVIALSLIFWKLGLFAVAYFSVLLIPKFGNSFPYWSEELVTTGFPSWVWGFGNFDGVHYLRIAKDGYFAQYSQAFFPLYPMSISMLSLDVFNLGKSFAFFYGAMFISTLSFLIAIYFLYKLFILDYDKKIVIRSILVLIFFPTAFYFGAIYTESLFLLFSVLCLLCARKKLFILSGLFGALASATKLIGVFLIIPMLIEAYPYLKNRLLNTEKLKLVLGLIMAPAGFFSYVYYLGKNFNDPLYFLTAQKVFGAQRSDEPFILLPQVFYRYAKILITVSPNTYQFFSAFLEVSFTIAVLVLLIFSFKRIKFSYWIFSFFIFIVPTLTGTLSSMPRYILMSFLLLPFFIQTTNRFFKVILTVFIIAQVILTCLFIRGYWIS